MASWSLKNPAEVFQNNIKRRMQARPKKLENKK